VLVQPTGLAFPYHSFSVGGVQRHVIKQSKSQKPKKTPMAELGPRDLIHSQIPKSANSAHPVTVADRACAPHVSHARTYLCPAVRCTPGSACPARMPPLWALPPPQYVHIHPSRTVTLNAQGLANSPIFDHLGVTSSSRLASSFLSKSLATGTTSVQKHECLKQPGILHKKNSRNSSCKSC
jgi:hypothetical protein